ncbi:AlpA family transcriptional regulator [Microbacterium testaceum]|uniref:helix-turn-helix transcriptional regulator n=1 Tax=Microbacterium testaceum TaxID=2033 RepID=UPI0012ACDE37|nr:helix-turn-helix domain-containing protein [Microbacterium testaceum]
MSSTAPASTHLLDSLITPATLAQRLGTTERSLSEWRITGRGPKFIRIGRSPRYRPEAVDEWLLSQEHGSTSEEAA